MFTVILPSAGQGTRLGLPYPKEIHRVYEGQSLIDFSLDHARACPDMVRQLAIVVTEEKQPVFDYVRATLPPSIAVERHFFNDAYTEWPGSILSAEPGFSDYNVALLPDSVLSPLAGERLLTQFDAEFSAGADVVFAYLVEPDPSRLTALGALRVNGNRVEEFCDKPNRPDAPRFNAFWTAFAFRKDAGPELLKMMMRSVAREPVSLNDLGMTVHAFPVSDYQDLGTWPSMNRYLSKKFAP